MSIPKAADLPYRIGKPDFECRYPVIIGGGPDERIIGHSYRWHRNWLTDSSAGEHNVGRPEKGDRGLDKAAAYLLGEYAAGRITAEPWSESSNELTFPVGPAPLLDRRMPDSERNVASARAALAKLAEYRWRPLAGFPGSDNPWVLLCELCDWVGPRYWSHLRGRNGAPPRISRHPGCVSEDAIREAIAAYRA